MNVFSFLSENSLASTLQYKEHHIPQMDLLSVEQDFTLPHTPAVLMEVLVHSHTLVWIDQSGHVLKTGEHLFFGLLLSGASLAVGHDIHHD